MKTKNKRWTVREETVGLLIKEPAPEVTNETEPSLLVGYKETGPLKGYTLPPGGGISEIDRMKNSVPRSQRYNCCTREIEEETGLVVRGGLLIALLDVRIIADRARHIVYIYRFDEWDGTPRARSPEFSKFFFARFSELGTLNVPPYDEIWLPVVLRTRVPKKVFLQCGIGRHDVIYSRITDLRLEEVL